MKALFSLSLLIVSVVIAGLFYLKAVDGKWAISIEQVSSKTMFIVQQARNIFTRLKGKLSNNKTTMTEVYRWQDNNGKWQYSNTAPIHQNAIKIEPQLSK